MISPKLLFETLADLGVNFFAGVPDSLLSDFCAYITDHADPSHHVITANEGNAVALSAGHFLGTGRPGLVYLQNSGLGNIINPLLSLTDREVYGLPVLLMIGWRGEPDRADEPQHIKQGRVTPTLLEAMQVPYQIIDADCLNVKTIVETALEQMKSRSGPAALLVRKGAFSSYFSKNKDQSAYPLSREQAIQKIIEQLGPSDRVVASTGMLSRELYEIRVARGEGVASDFLTVGSMGHASSISLGLAQGQANRRVVCLDGDGSVLMHMGSLAILGQSCQRNLIHVVLNNGAHDSVGGQPTCGFAVNLPSIARACGYRNVESASKVVEIEKKLDFLLAREGPSFFEVRVKRGARDNLGRPFQSPLESRESFMRSLSLDLT